MKLHFLILIIVLLAIGCSSKPAETNENANLLRTNQVIATPKEKDEPKPDETVDDALLLKTIQEFISANYSGWALKGTERQEAPYIDLHVVRNDEAKIIKVNYKKFTDLNGQPYLVITKVREEELNKPAIEENKHTDEANVSSNK